MIYAYAILTGYVAIRGSMFLHIPMLIAMVAFVRIPEAEDDPALVDAWRIWYTYAAIMHAILAILHFLAGLHALNVTAIESDAVESIRQGFQMVAVLA